MDGVLDLQRITSSMIQNLQFFWNNILLVKIGDLLSDSESWVVQILLAILNKNEALKDYFLDLTLLSVILFGAVFSFIIITLAKWVIDIIL